MEPTWFSKKLPVRLRAISVRNISIVGAIMSVVQEEQFQSEIIFYTGISLLTEYFVLEHFY
jgi:hypothetical protein